MNTPILTTYFINGSIMFIFNILFLWQCHESPTSSSFTFRTARRQTSHVRATRWYECRNGTPNRVHERSVQSNPGTIWRHIWPGSAQTRILPQRWWPPNRHCVSSQEVQLRLHDWSWAVNQSVWMVFRCWDFTYEGMFTLLYYYIPEVQSLIPLSPGLET